MPYKDPEKRKIQNRAYQKKHYKNNAQYYKDKAKLGKIALRDWYVSLKSTKACVRCGENHPACLDFHHIDPALKTIIVSKMPTTGCSKKRILEEISKCIVLCSNCHRKEHFYKS